MVPKIKYHNGRAAAIHSPSIAPHVQIDIDISTEGMWLLAHYCIPATTVRVRMDMGRKGGRREGGGDGGKEGETEGEKMDGGNWIAVGREMYI